MGLYLINFTVCIFFTITVIYTLFFSLVGKIRRQRKLEESELKARIAILIPAYKEDEVIISVSKAMLCLDYPKDKYEVFVIADQLKNTTISSLKEVGVEVVSVSFDVSTKAKSLNYCLNKITSSDFDVITICDADNILSRSFLKKVNSAFQSGHKVIQGRRVAKNLNSDYAVLDGASEIINNHIFRKGPSNTGLSASLIGSGMAFGVREIKSALSTIDAIGGFDKILQLSLIEKGHKILYLEDALVYDEKVANSDNFKNQRRRWLASQYKYLAKFFGKGVKQLLKGNIDYFNIAVLHNLFLPRVLNLGILLMLAILSLFADSINLLSSWDYWILFLAYVFAMLIALPKNMFNYRLLVAIFSLPSAFLNMFFLLFKLKGADKKFIHTKHSVTEVDNSLFSVDE